ncbi:MAG TPA: condensation domain-containing protein, partial [Longimicrobium sp.]|nr:condensation domain-containing protein [Longimicrobium sp.]
MNTVHPPHRLSFAQERLWFLDQMQPGTPVYNVYSAYRLSGPLDAAALERALARIVRRHDVLRTTFPVVDGMPVQGVAPFTGFALPVQDAAGLDDAALLRAATDEAARPFDLATGPLFRATLLRIADDDHLLLTVMHHVVSDGWSMRVLFRELVALYAADLDGRGAELPELSLQYAAFAGWQREQLEGNGLDGQLAWWKARLAGAPELLALPLDRPRPAIPSPGGASVPVHARRRVLDRLQALGAAERASLHTVLLAAFQVLLARYGGSDDVVVGSPIAGRTRRDVEGLIGCFVNMLVMRTDLGGARAFRDVLRRVRTDALGAYEHQDLPFERLVTELRPERSASHAPLFQVMFTTDTFEAVSADALPGLRVTSVDAELPVARFDLSLTLSATGRGLAGTLAYSTDLFDRATMERMARHMERVLEQVADNPDIPLCRLELLDADERARMVDEWNRTDRDFPRDTCLHDRFQAQVLASPDAVALVWDDVHLTRAELDARANRLAHYLLRLGVGPDARVGVLLERGVELVVSLLAILKAGGAYVPLDPADPAERLRMMLHDSGARVLVTREAHAAAVNATAVHPVRLDADADAIAREPADAPASGATAENLAYVVYTSGSTGRPKGVMVSHRNVVQLVVDTDYVHFGPRDRVAQASSASFDALAFEVWGALLNGATLVGIGRDALLSPPALRTLLREQGITTLYQTTALLNQLSREQPDTFASVRDVLFGGQAVDADGVRRVLKGGAPRRLLHMYGPTETTAW